MGFISKWKARLFAPKIPVVRLENSARTIEFLGHIRKRENSLIDDWNQKGYEIQSQPTEIKIDGKKEIGYIVDEAGVTVTLNRDIKILAPEQPTTLSPNDPIVEIETITKKPIVYVNYNFQGIIGRCATLDDIAEGLDIGKSLKNTFIGFLIGVPVGWIFTQAMQ